MHICILVEESDSVKPFIPKHYIVFWCDGVGNTVLPPTADIRLQQWQTDTTYFFVYACYSPNYKKEKKE